MLTMLLKMATTSYHISYFAFKILSFAYWSAKQPLLQKHFEIHINYTHTFFSIISQFHVPQLNIDIISSHILAAIQTLIYIAFTRLNRCIDIFIYYLVNDDIDYH